MLSTCLCNEIMGFVGVPWKERIQKMDASYRESMTRWSRLSFEDREIRTITKSCGRTIRVSLDIRTCSIVVYHMIQDINDSTIHSIQFFDNNID